MAIGWQYFAHLDRNGIFRAGGSILDIGAQNIFDMPVEPSVDFLRRAGSSLSDHDLRVRMVEMSERAVWPPKRVGVFLREFLEGTAIRYTGLDIFPGPGVEVFDLNYDTLPEHHGEQFDVVLNFGTTEHIFNQYNCFKVMHEAASAGAWMFHQVPAMGYMDHGYWIYSPRVFTELAEANDYEVCELWCSGPQGSFNLFERLTYADSATDASLPENVVDLWRDTPIVNGLVNVLLRKRRSGPFRLGLDISTSARAPAERIVATYFSPAEGDGPGKRMRLLRLFTARELGEELMFRVRRRLRIARS